LSLAEDGSPAGTIQGIDVYVSLDGGGEYVRAESLQGVGGIAILEDECGIRFLGDQPPIEMVQAGTATRVKVVATVRGDCGWSYSRGGQPAPSVLRNFDSMVHLDGRGRYQVRKIDQSSLYYPEVSGGQRNSLEVDHLAELKAIVDTLQDTWNRADCAGTITLYGLHRRGFTLGDVVPAIQGRNIDLHTHHDS